jgi:phosphoesterase RecJ-like protein
MTMPADPPAARARLAAARRVLLITHVNPDGDAIGSLLGLGLALRAAGKDVVMACADPVPEVYRFLPAADEISMAPEGPFDLVAVVDVSEIARIGAIRDRLDGPPDLQFDHHITNPGFAELNFVDVRAASTAELLAELLPGLGLALSHEVAQCLLTGLVTDSLGFRTSSTTTKTLAIAQQLMQAGAQLHTVYDLALFKRSYSAVRLWAQGLAHLHLKHRMAWARISLEARKASGYQGLGDADLINILTTIREAAVALVFVEQADGKVKISWRSVPGINVAEIAAEFGGGGHAAAAGAEVPGTLEEVETRVLAATRARLKAVPVPAPA